MENINENILRLTGKVSLPKPLALSKSYVVSIEGDVTESKDIDNQDGTYNREFKFEPRLVEVVNENGDRLKTRDKSKMHQKIRGRHHIWATDCNSDMDYEEFGAKLIEHFDDVMEVILNG